MRKSERERKIRRVETDRAKGKNRTKGSVAMEHGKESTTKNLKKE